MHKKLPARPHLEHLRRQAKNLLAAFKAGDPKAIQEFASHHVGSGTDKVSLADAQCVVARKSGFSSWPKLVHYVEQLRALEGTWLFMSLECEGSQQPEESLKSSRLLLNGDRFRVEDSLATYEGIFDINVEVDPHTIDIDFIEGPEAGNSSYGIYECEGNHLTICLGLTGYARPLDFVTLPGSGHVLETLQRSGRDPQSTTSPSPSHTVQEVDLASHEGFDVMTPTLEALQGEWVSTSIMQDGMVLPEAFVHSGKRVAQGNLTTVTFGKQIWMKALTRVVVSEKEEPQEIDYLHLQGQATGQVQRGLLSLAEDEMQTCIAQPGAPRPSSLTSPSGSGWTLSTWRCKH